MYIDGEVRWREQNLKYPKMLLSSSHPAPEIRLVLQRRKFKVNDLTEISLGTFWMGIQPTRSYCKPESFFLLEKVLHITCAYNLRGRLRVWIYETVKQLTTARWCQTKKQITVKLQAKVCDERIKYHNYSSISEKDRKDFLLDTEK